MATRCEVIVQHHRGEIHFYHHYDGYPEGVGIELMKIIDKYPIRKGSDGEPDDPSIDLNAFIRDLVAIERSPYEFTAYRHSDIEYRYILNIHTRELQCFEGYYEYDEAADGEESSEFVPHRTCDMNGYYKEYMESIDNQDFGEDRLKAYEAYCTACDAIRPKYEKAIELV